MLTTAREEVPRQPLHRSWPLKFFQARPHFNRKAENQPYIEWLKDYLYEGDEASEDGDDGDDNDNEDYADDDVSVCMFEFVPLPEPIGKLDLLHVPLFHPHYLVISGVAPH
jgi:hypothetical protein